MFNLVYCIFFEEATSPPGEVERVDEPHLLSTIPHKISVPAQILPQCTTGKLTAASPSCTAADQKTVKLIYSLVVPAWARPALHCTLLNTTKY